MKGMVNMKKIIALLLGAVITASGFAALAQNEVTVNFEGQKMEFDVSPFIENESTLMPVRAIFQATGASVNWDNDTKTVLIVSDDNGEQKFIIMQIGNPDVFVNGEKKTLSIAAKIVGDRTFVPLRFIMETLGRDVSWDENTRTVNIK